MLGLLQVRFADQHLLADINSLSEQLVRETSEHFCYCFRIYHFVESYFLELLSQLRSNQVPEIS